MVPSQEAHAKRLLEVCAHLRQIRFNLCPKRMKDEDFWQVTSMRRGVRVLSPPRPAPDRAGPPWPSQPPSDSDAFWACNRPGPVPHSAPTGRRSSHDTSAAGRRREVPAAGPCSESLPCPDGSRHRDPLRACHRRRRRIVCGESAIFVFVAARRGRGRYLDHDRDRARDRGRSISSSCGATRSRRRRTWTTTASSCSPTTAPGGLAVSVP